MAPSCHLSRSGAAQSGTTPLRAGPRRSEQDHAAQSRITLPPVTLIRLGGSAAVAGPVTTAPLPMLNSLPWQGQSMVPLTTLLTRHPTWVHTALKARNLPATGCVTTTFCAG